ncbi:acetylglutamate kinase [Bacillus sp. 1P06AnD]|uniref:acetylglutamate kinase n=1 Tax=Bacillus sp. 1P06AnD TaxID=3132208 RepID=UPI0039A01D7F
MKILLLKLGGSILDELDDSFFASLQDLQREGYRLIFVHGGGPDINQMLETLHIIPEFHDGLRKTTSDVLDVVELVLSGKTNRSLVGLLNQHGFNAIGLHGSDAGLLKGRHIDKESLGEVGEITSVNSELIKNVLDMGLVPVLTPLAVSEWGTTLNVNADMAAGAVARALDADSCVFVTDVKGVLHEGKLIESLTAEEVERLIREKVILGGMIPKVQTALKALETGIRQVRIVNGKDAFFSKGNWIGTTFSEKAGMQS